MILIKAKKFTIIISKKSIVSKNTFTLTSNNSAQSIFKTMIGFVTWPSFYMVIIYVATICDCILENWPYWHYYWNPFFACRWKPHSCTIQRHQALETRWPGMLLQAAFSEAVKPQGCLSWHLWPLRGINKTAWGAKLILTADLAYMVSCAGLGHLLMLKHCPLSLNVFFTPPMAPHLPPPPTPYLLNPCHYSSWNKPLQKPGAFK